MVADRDVEEPAAVGGPRDGSDLVGAGLELPRLDEVAALRLHRQLDAEDGLARRNDRRHGPSLTAPRV